VGIFLFVDSEFARVLFGGDNFFGVFVLGQRSGRQLEYKGISGTE